MTREATTVRSAELRATDPYIPGAGSPEASESPLELGGKQIVLHVETFPLTPQVHPWPKRRGLKVARVGRHDLPVPARQTDGACGYDLQMCGQSEGGIEQNVCIYPGNRLMIKTGFAWSIPDGWAGMICPRSGLAHKSGLDKLAGLIDFDFNGEVRVILVNHGDVPVNFAHGDRIAQMVIVPCLTEEVELVESLDATERGEGGFGSTGVASA